MQVQWFPGHMNKARKEMEKVLDQVDIVVEVLDARIPHSSQNPMLAALGSAKPRIRVFNKIDLADLAVVSLWQAHLEQEQQVRTLTISADQTRQAAQVRQLCRRMVPAGKKQRTALILIAGIPNVGKSTLINTLAGRAVANTGNEPAITKSQQRIKLGDGLALLDSPGVLWPNIENIASGYRLALTGAIRETAMDHEDTALFALGYLRQHYPDNLKQRYQLDVLSTNDTENLQTIGRKTGCLGAGGHIDTVRAGTRVVTDIRSGKLGRVCFETPAMVTLELAEIAVRKADREALEKAGKKAGEKSGEKIGRQPEAQ